MAKPMSEVDASSNGLSSLINNLITKLLGGLMLCEDWD